MPYPGEYKRIRVGFNAVQGDHRRGGLSALYGIRCLAQRRNVLISYKRKQRSRIEKSIRRQLSEAYCMSGCICAWQFTSHVLNVLFLLVFIVLDGKQSQHWSKATGWVFRVVNHSLVILHLTNNVTWMLNRAVDFSSGLLLLQVSSRLYHSALLCLHTWNPHANVFLRVHLYL